MGVYPPQEEPCLATPGNPVWIHFEFVEPGFCKFPQVLTPLLMIAAFSHSCLPPYLHFSIVCLLFSQLTLKASSANKNKWDHLMVCVVCSKYQKPKLLWQMNGDTQYEKCDRCVFILLNAEKWNPKLSSSVSLLLTYVFPTFLPK